MASLRRVAIGPGGQSRLNAAQIEPLALHYMDAERDLEDDIPEAGSFWRRITRMLRVIYRRRGDFREGSSRI